MFKIIYKIDEMSKEKMTYGKVFVESKPLLEVHLHPLRRYELIFWFIRNELIYVEKGVYTRRGKQKRSKEQLEFYEQNFAAQNIVRLGLRGASGLGITFS